MAPELIILIVAAGVVVALVGLSITVRNTPADRTSVPREAPETLEPPKPGAVDGALDVVDRSIGMYLLRRLTGRPTTSKPPPPDEPAVALSADEVAYRIGVAGTPQPATHVAAPKSPLVGGPTATAVTAAARPTAGLARPTTPGAPVAPRERLVRDSGVALLALVVVGLVAVLFWPHDPTGEPRGSVFVVNREVVTPSPTGEVEAATAENSGEPETPIASAEPTGPLTPGSTPGTHPTAKPTPRVTLRPGQTPTPTPRTTPTPTSNPTTTPSSTPDVTPTPTPDVTPPPTPEPTPTPTPEPTPTPTPVESPSP